MRRMIYKENKEAINARKRELYAEQAYRKVKRGKAEEISLTRGGKEVAVSVRKVESYDTSMYISDQAKSIECN